MVILLICELEAIVSCCSPVDDLFICDLLEDLDIEFGVVFLSLVIELLEVVS